MTAVINSTKGYSMGILHWHLAHLAFKKTYEKRGILWYHLIFSLQVGQKELGLTIDKPRGNLYISTLKKEPKHKPNRKTKRYVIKL